MGRKFASAAAITLLVGASGVARAEDDSATVNGLTFYGAIDVGVTYDTHGAQSSNVGNTGSYYLVQKASNRSTFNFAQSGMGQSNIGLKGANDLGDGWTGLFKLETAINPAGGNITDGSKALVSNNGRPMQSWTAAGDTSASGQAFARAAYVGVSNQTYGTLTAGLQTNLNADAISTYDPGYGSYAFSLIGYSGFAAGSSDTDNTRWDNSVKYLYAYGPARLGVQYAFGGTSGRNDTGYAADLGFDYDGLSVDAVYVNKKDGVSVSSLSAPQVAGLAALGYSPSNSLSATVSDNDSYTIAALYKLNNLKLFAGFEYVQSKNPSSPLPVGFTNIGGYTAAYVNNTAFPNTRDVDIAWTGARYAFTPKLELAGAYYYYHQNAYGSGANAGCNDTRSGTCSGDEHVFSLVANYHFTKRFDTYAGAMYSQLLNGMASGALKNNNLSPTVGIRYTF